MDRDWNEEKRAHVTDEQPEPEVLTLLELPSEAAKRGFAALEVCHFHFPSREPAYLSALRQAFADAGVSFDTLLLDYGDITTTKSDRLEADLALIRGWIDTASAAGTGKFA